MCMPYFFLGIAASVLFVLLSGMIWEVFKNLVVRALVSELTNWYHVRSEVKTALGLI